MLPQSSINEVYRILMSLAKKVTECIWVAHCCNDGHHNTVKMDLMIKIYAKYCLDTKCVVVPKSFDNIQNKNCLLPSIVSCNYYEVYIYFLKKKPAESVS